MPEAKRSEPPSQWTFFKPVVRRRVLDRLSRASEHRVALIVAPAGYGKSIALTHFLSELQGDCVRYELRGDNGSLLGFVRGLAESFRGVAPKAVLALKGAYEASLGSEAAPANLATWLYAHLESYRGFVAIDDFHLARGDARISAFLAEFIAQTKDRVHWLIATRDPLELPLASWQAYGLLGALVGEGDLRLRVDEAAAIARGSAASVPPQALREILELTDGWPTALVFALGCTTRSADFGRVTGETRALVYRYLAEQVYADLSKADRDFLLATCVYPYVDVELLSAAGYEDAYARVDHLRRHTAFLQADSETVFRYHDLFRDFLEHELKRHGREVFSRTVETAADVLAQAGSHADALLCYRRASATAQVLRMIEERGFDLIDHGKADVVESAMGILCDHDRNENPVILAMRAIFEDQREHGDQADAWFRKSLDLAIDPVLRMRLTLHYALTFGRRDPESSLALLEPYAQPTDAPPELQARVCASLASGHALFGHSEVAASLIARALKLATTLHDDALRAAVYLRAGNVACCGNEPKEARQYYLRAAQLAEDCGEFCIEAYACDMLADLDLNVNDEGERAVSYLRRSLDRAAKGGDPAFLAYAHYTLYKLEVERAADAGILHDLEIEMQRMNHAATWVASWSLLPARAMRFSWGGKFNEAYELLAGTIEERSMEPAMRAQQWGEIALYAAAAGRRSEAQVALDAAQRELGAQVHQKRISARVRLHCAVAALTLGQRADADRMLRSIERGDLAQSMRLKSLLKAVRALYAHAQTGFGSENVKATFSTLHEHGYGGYARLFERLSIPSTTRLAALTDAELRVLRVLSVGGSSRDIAQSLGISPRTVDAHVRSIVAKLQCRGRRGATALAIEYGLAAETASDHGDAAGS